MRVETSQKRWRRAGMFFIGVALFVTLWSVFCGEENWRGKRAWEECKRELKAKGLDLDWKEFDPPPVAADANFFKAPNMQLWFVRQRADTNLPPIASLAGLSTNKNTSLEITNETVAKAYLQWSDHFQPEFQMIREAMKRPDAQIDGDYSNPYESPHPSINRIIGFVKVLRQRAKCYLLLGQSDRALGELLLLNDFRRLLERPSTGRPMSVVSTMVDTVVIGFFVETIEYGLRTHTWSDSQLILLQERLQTINLLALTVDSLKFDARSSAYFMETIAPNEIQRQFSQPTFSGLWQKLENPLYYIVPRGWAYQNMVVADSLMGRLLEGIDLKNNLVNPQKVEEADLDRFHAGTRWPLHWSRLANVLDAGLVRAVMQIAHTATMVNEAQVACALERYHLAHGGYPESLAALAPEFMASLPHDLIGGHPLHYQHTDDGSFLLYSIGWMAKDVGGRVAFKKDGTIDIENGNWVWRSWGL